MAEEIVKDAGYFMEHPEEFEKLGEEDQRAFMFGGEPQGDTKSETSPDLTEKDSEPEKVEEPAKVDEQPGVQAKDGKHIIPFKELEDTRAMVDRLKQTTTEQAALIADLQAAKEKDEATGGTKAQDAVIAEYEGEYPELMEDLKPVLEKMSHGIEARMEARIKDLEAKLQPAPVAEPEIDPKWDAAQKAFFGAAENELFHHNKNPALFDKLNDAVKTVAQSEGGEALSYEEVLKEAKDMVFASMGVKMPDASPPPAPDLKKVVDAKLKQVEDQVPSSLSDMPGASSAHHDEAEAMLEMDGLSLVNKFLNMTPDKIEENLNRIL